MLTKDNIEKFAERIRCAGNLPLSLARSPKNLEARVGFEPTNDGFADHPLVLMLWYPLLRAGLAELADAPDQIFRSTMVPEAP